MFSAAKQVPSLPAEELDLMEDPPALFLTAAGAKELSGDAELFAV
jgi:hypothetical protein